MTTYTESQARAGKGNKGKPKSPEHRAKLAKALAKAREVKAKRWAALALKREAREL